MHGPQGVMFKSCPTYPNMYSLNPRSRRRLSVLSGSQEMTNTTTTQSRRYRVLFPRLPPPPPTSRRRRAPLPQLRSLPLTRGRVTRRKRSASRSWAALPKMRRRAPRLPTSMVRPPGMVRQRRWCCSCDSCCCSSAWRPRWFQKGRDDSLR